MKHFSQTKTLPFTPHQIFEVVRNVDAYAEFLPWCIASRVHKTIPLPNDQAELHADLIIGFQLYKEKFTSKIILTKDQTIDIEYIKGPFKKMRSIWRLTPIGKDKCEVHFESEFEFNNFIFRKLSDIFFEEVATKMIDSFEKRAYDLYKE